MDILVLEFGPLNRNRFLLTIGAAVLLVVLPMLAIRLCTSAGPAGARELSNRLVTDPEPTVNPSVPPTVARRQAIVRPSHVFVVTPDDRPVPEARIEVYALYASDPEFGSSTDDQGVVELPKTLLGRVWISALGELNGERLSGSAFVSIESSGSRHRLVVETGKCAILGMVHRDGVGLSDIPILHTDNAVLTSTSSASDGSFIFDDLKPGWHGLRLGTADDPLIRWESTLEPGKHYYVSLKVPRAIVSVKLIELGGAPLEEKPVVSLSAVPELPGGIRRFRSVDTNRVAEFTGVPPGRYFVVYGSYGYSQSGRDVHIGAPAWEYITVEDSDVHVVLGVAEPAYLEIQAVEESSGWSVPAIAWISSQDAGPLRSRQSQAVLASTGYVGLRVPPGDVELTVFANRVGWAKRRYYLQSREIVRDKISLQKFGPRLELRFTGARSKDLTELALYSESGVLFFTYDIVQFSIASREGTPADQLDFEATLVAASVPPGLYRAVALAGELVLVDELISAVNDVHMVIPIPDQ